MMNIKALIEFINKNNDGIISKQEIADFQETQKSASIFDNYFNSMNGDVDISTFTTSIEKIHNECVQDGLIPELNFKDDYIAYKYEQLDISTCINDIISFNDSKYANKKILINGQYCVFDERGNVTHIYDSEDEESLSAVIVYYHDKPKGIYKYNESSSMVFCYNERFESNGQFYVEDDEEATDSLNYQYSRDALIYGMLDKSLTIKKIKNILKKEDAVHIMRGYLDADGREDIGQEFKHSLLGDIASFDGGVKLVNSIIHNKIKEAKKTGVYIEDIVADINSHKTDYAKLDIDLLRLNGRIDYTRSEGSDDTDLSTLDGVLSENISQNYATDDCFLVSSLIAIDSNRLGHKSLSMLRKTLPNGDVEIKCQANNKIYTITKEELKNSNYLSNGDLDMRVYEIMLDRYRRDVAYENPINHGCGGYGINGGGWCDDVAIAFLGKHTIKVTAIDNANCVYTFAFNPLVNPKLSIKAYDSNGQEVELYTAHEYSVKSFDKEFVYFVDPYDSSNLLHIKKQDLYKERSVEIEALDLSV